MFKKVKFMTTVIALSLMGFGLAACETLNGAGRDIEKAGEAVQEAAQ